MTMDKTPNEFKRWITDMPFLLIRHGNECIPRNVEKYEVKCIPTLIVLNN